MNRNDFSFLIFVASAEHFSIYDECYKIQRSTRSGWGPLTYSVQYLSHYLSVMWPQLPFLNSSLLIQIHFIYKLLKPTSQFRHATIGYIKCRVGILLLSQHSKAFIRTVWLGALIEQETSLTLSPMTSSTLPIESRHTYRRYRWDRKKSSRSVFHMLLWRIIYLSTWQDPLGLPFRISKHRRSYVMRVFLICSLRCGRTPHW